MCRRVGSGGSDDSYFCECDGFTGPRCEQGAVKKQLILIHLRKCLKEYYEIVDEARPLSGFFPTHADFFTEMHFYS